MNTANLIISHIIYSQHKIAPTLSVIGSNWNTLTSRFENMCTHTTQLSARNLQSNVNKPYTVQYHNKNVAS